MILYAINKKAAITTKKEVFTRFLYYFGRYIFFFAVFLFYEFILRARTADIFWDYGLLKTAMMCFFYAVALTAISSLFPKKAAAIIAGALLSFTSLIYISQFICRVVKQSFYNFEMAKQGSELAGVWGIVMNGIWNNIFYIILYLFPIAVYFIIVRQITGLPKFSRIKNAVVAVASQVIVLSLLIPCILLPQSSAYTVNMIGAGGDNIALAAGEIGILGAMNVDFLKIFIKPEPDNFVNQEVNQEDINKKYGIQDSKSNYIVEDIPAGLLINDIPPAESTTEPNIPETPKEYGYNVLDIDFDKLAENESNKNIKSMHEYFAQVSPTKQHQYTGMFEGYNLIFLTAEAFSHHAVDKDLTPTLYKMVNEGFVFTEFYTAVGTCTSSGEFSATTGLTTEDGVRSYQRTMNNSMPFAMGNMLRPLGYKTMAYHNHNYKYYDRHLTHPNMGYEFKGYGNGLETRATWPQSDLEMMEKSIDDYINAQPFHAYYMTVSGHMDYSFSSNYLSGKNKDLVAHLPYCEASRAYLAAQIELDRALEYLLMRLEEAGIAEKTLFVLAADHYPYGLTIEQIGEIAGHEIEPNFELYRSALIMYAKGMNPVTVSKPCSSMDIIPTLYNLMGLDFDSRLFSGSDILSESKPLVLFKNKSFITDTGRYNASTKVFEPNADYAGLDIDFSEYRTEMSKIVSQKFDIAKRIIDNDYYKYVLP